MDLNEIKAYLETNKDNDDVKNYLSELSKVTIEGVNQFVETDDGKKWIGKHNDSFFTKSLETWKKNNLQKLIDEAVKKANPDETSEQKQIRELTERLDAKEKAEKRQTLLNKSLLIADEKKLPKDILEYFLGEDEETTTKNIEKLESVFNKSVESVVNERLKSDYKPPKGDDNNKDNDIASFKQALGL